MKICKECEKKFGILEKIYYTDNGDMFCSSCVQMRKEQKETAPVNLAQTEEKPDYPYVKIPSEKESSPKYEFRVIKLSSDPMQKTTVTIEKFEDVINKMGEDGWELVSVIPLHVLLMKSSAREEPALIFKRIKSDSLSVRY